MQFMLVSTKKEGTSPSDMAGIMKKFQSWSPPDGLTVDGLWSNTEGSGYMLVSADDLGLVAEVAAQFSATHHQHVDPVSAMMVAGQPATGADDAMGKMLRGLEWAAK